MDFLVKRGRGLDPAVLGWLMGTLGVGPGIGEVHFLVKAASAYYSWLRDDMRVNPSLIHYSLADGEDALTGDRNDVLAVYPGTYTETVMTTWDKRNTHLIGLGGPNIQGYDTYGTQIYTATAALAAVIYATGQRSQFHNITVANNGANAGNLSAFKVGGYGVFAKGCQFMGMMNATQAAVAAANSLEIAAGGSYFQAINCAIGDHEWSTQGAANGQLYFSNTVTNNPPAAGKFENCVFRGQHSNNARILVKTLGNYAVGREWLFDRCHFYAFWLNHTDKSLQVFSDGDTTTHDFILRDCVATGFDEFKTVAGMVYNSMSAADASGGIPAAAVL